MPLVLETIGGWGKMAEAIVGRLSQALADVERTDMPSARRTVRTSISFAAQRALAEGFMMRNMSNGSQFGPCKRKPSFHPYILI